METITFDSTYWKKELEKTNLELAELINGDLSTLKTAKTVKDTTTLQELNQMVKAKLAYRELCEEEIEKAKNKEQGLDKKSLLYINRECGY